MSPATPPGRYPTRRPGGAEGRSEFNLGGQSSSGPMPRDGSHPSVERSAALLIQWADSRAAWEPRGTIGPPGGPTPPPAAAGPTATARVYTPIAAETCRRPRPAASSPAITDTRSLTSGIRTPDPWQSAPDTRSPIPDAHTQVLTPTCLKTLRALSSLFSYKINMYS